MAEDFTTRPPDRLSLDPRSDYFDEALLSRGVGIKFNGQEKTSVIEYSISEGWIRVAAGHSRDRYGQPMTLKLKGKVEPYFEKPALRSAEGEGGRRFRRIGRASRAALVAPFPERPAAKRQRGQRRHAAPRQRGRAVAEDRALGALCSGRRPSRPATRLQACPT